MKQLFYPVLLLALGFSLVACWPAPAHAGSCSMASYSAPSYVAPAVRSYTYYPPAVKQSYIAPAYAAPVKVYKAAAYEAPAYVAPAVVAVPVAVYVPVPLYAASYVAPVVAPPAVAAPPPAHTTPPAPAHTTPPAHTEAARAPQGGCNQERILEVLRKLDARLDALERGRPGVPPAPPPPAPPGKPPPGDPFNPPTTPGGTGSITTPATGHRGPAVFATKCAQCHQRGKESDGNGFVLMEADGSPTRLDPRAMLAVARKVYSGNMPPKKSAVPALTDAEVAEVMAWVDSASVSATR